MADYKSSYTGEQIDDGIAKANTALQEEQYKGTYSKPSGGIPKSDLAEAVQTLLKRKGIVSITKTGTSGLIDTYTITYTDNTTSTFTVTNGANGQNGTNGKDGKDGTNGTNGQDGQDGEDGRGIVSILKTGTEGLVDIYTITYTDNTTSTFTVTNGQDGSGESSVEANPELEGNEEYLKGLKVGNTKYSTRPDLSGKVISIMGDSISTYAGWIPNSAGIDDGTGTLRHAIYYPNYGTYLSNVNMTWWHKLIFDKFKAKFGINESWSGSFVGNNKDTNTATTTTCHAPGNDTGPDTCMASNTRIKRLSANGTPDIIYVYGGTNDIAQPGTPGESLGTFNSATDYSTVDTTTTKWTYFVDAYRTMIQRMQYYYPKAKIIALLPTYCHSYYNRAKLDEWVEQIKLICDYFGVNYIDLRACGITWANSSASRNAKGVQTLGDQNIHPNDLGHTMIADYVEAETYKILQQDYIENTVHTVTNNLSTLTNTMSYITGVTNGESYLATLTGTDLTVGRVSMGGIDITSTAYDNTTGIISIASVTGNIIINEGEAVITPVTGVSLNASTKSIMPNDVETLTATIIPGNATNKNVTWSVNNSHVTINPNGLSCTVTGASNGTSIVTVTTEDGEYTATCTFTVHEIVLERIAITTPPSTTAYHYGDTFSKTGMVVTAYYDDETSEVLDDTDYIVSPSGALTDSDTLVTISYTYNGVTKTATQAITVSTLSSIEITTQPSQTEYVVGKTFNPAGMVVTATWSDNTTSTITGYTFSPSGALTDEDTVITISYTVGGVTRTTTQAITVTEAPETTWYTNVYEFSGWENPTTDSITTAGDFGYSGSNVKALYENKTINTVRLVPAKAGTITVRVYNDASDIIGRTDTASLRTGDTATITITQDMVSQGGYQEIPLSNDLHIGQGQFWTIQTARDTGLFKFVNSATIPEGYKFYNMLGTNESVRITIGNNALCVDMGYNPAYNS